MEIKEYQAAIEAVLFASGEPVAATRLAEVLELDLETAVRLADDWLQDVNTRGGGLLAVRLGDKYQLCTNKAYAGYVRRAMDIRRNTPLSQAAMEVLAIVAYNQPVTKAFIEQVRGVDCGAVVQGLAAKGLIEEKGRLEEIWKKERLFFFSGFEQRSWNIRGKCVFFLNFWKKSLTEKSCMVK